MDISVLIPVYNDEAALPELYRALADILVRMLHLSRNYGQTAALMAAIRNSTGEVIIPMDGDGQNDPADIPRLIARLAEGYDVVSGWRTARQDGALTRRLPSVV